jgi:hypothetical protein
VTRDHHWQQITYVSDVTVTATVFTGPSGGSDRGSEPESERMTVTVNAVTVTVTVTGPGCQPLRLATQAAGQRPRRPARAATVTCDSWQDEHEPRAAHW